MSWVKRAAAAVAIVALVLVAVAAIALEVCLVFKAEGKIIKTAWSLLEGAAHIAVASGKLVAQTAQAGLGLIENSQLAHNAAKAVHTIVASPLVHTAGAALKEVGSGVQAIARESLHLGQDLTRHMPTPVAFMGGNHHQHFLGASSATNLFLQPDPIGLTGSRYLSQPQQNSSSAAMPRAYINPIRISNIANREAEIERFLIAEVQKPSYNSALPMAITITDPNEQSLYKMICAKQGVSASLTVFNRPDIQPQFTDNRAHFHHIVNELIKFKNGGTYNPSLPLTFDVDDKKSRSLHIQACKQLNMPAIIGIKNSSEKPVSTSKNDMMLDPNASPRRRV
jgi:hypothetical protein